MIFAVFSLERKMMLSIHAWLTVKGEVVAHLNFPFHGKHRLSLREYLLRANSPYG